MLNSNIIYLSLVISIPLLFSGCYRKSLHSSDDGVECSEKEIKIDLLDEPSPYIEEWKDCPNPVYMKMRYKVSNNDSAEILIDTVIIEGTCYNGDEQFFQWEYIDPDHHTLSPGRFYVVVFDGILVGAELNHTTHFSYGVEGNKLTLTLIYHLGLDGCSESFETSTVIDIPVYERYGQCPG